MSALPVVAISIGDPNGVGTEIILKSFQDKYLFEHCIPVIYADYDFVREQQEHFGVQIPLQLLDDCPKKSVVYVKSVWGKTPKIEFGKQTSMAGAAAFESLQAAALAVKQKEADVLVTAPIHKAAIKSDAFPFAGHTHYLASVWSGKALMVLVHQKLRVALLTDHIPLTKVALSITPKLIHEKIHQLVKTLKVDFGYSCPKIALLGLNPHAGDQGVIGSEDERILRPAIEKLQKEGVDISGPFAADGFFGLKNYQNFNAVVSCYHDQGLVGFKTIAFGNGVNITAGLPFVRTSPDHGTAFDIAGKGIANYLSFATAVKQACDIWNARQKNN